MGGLEGFYGVDPSRELKRVKVASGQMCPVIRTEDGYLEILSLHGMAFDSGCISLICTDWKDVRERAKYERLVPSTEPEELCID